MSSEQGASTVCECEGTDVEGFCTRGRVPPPSDEPIYLQHRSRTATVLHAQQRTGTLLTNQAERAELQESNMWCTALVVPRRSGRSA